MNKLFLAAPASVAALASMPAAANAQTREDCRQNRQSSRIQEGVQRGQLTRGETHRLVRGQRHVARMEARAEHDGVVTRGESRRIERAQDHQSRAIFRLRHNATAR